MIIRLAFITTSSRRDKGTTDGTSTGREKTRNEIAPEQKVKRSSNRKAIPEDDPEEKCKHKRNEDVSSGAKKTKGDKEGSSTKKHSETSKKEGSPLPHHHHSSAPQPDKKESGVTGISGEKHKNSVSKLKVAAAAAAAAAAASSHPADSGQTALKGKDSKKNSSESKTKKEHEKKKESASDEKGNASKTKEDSKCQKDAKKSPDVFRAKKGGEKCNQEEVRDDEAKLPKLKTRAVSSKESKKEVSDDKSKKSSEKKKKEKGDEDKTPLHKAKTATEMSNDTNKCSREDKQKREPKEAEKENVCDDKIKLHKAKTDVESNKEPKKGGNGVKSSSKSGKSAEAKGEANATPKTHRKSSSVKSETETSKKPKRKVSGEQKAPSKNSGTSEQGKHHQQSGSDPNTTKKEEKSEKHKSTASDDAEEPRLGKHEHHTSKNSKKNATVGAFSPKKSHRDTGISVDTGLLRRKEDKSTLLDEGAVTFSVEKDALSLKDSSEPENEALTRKPATKMLLTKSAKSTQSRDRCAEASKGRTLLSQSSFINSTAYQLLQRKTHGSRKKREAVSRANTFFSDSSDNADGLSTGASSDNRIVLKVDGSLPMHFSHERIGFYDQFSGSATANHKSKKYLHVEVTNQSSLSIGKYKNAHLIGTTNGAKLYVGQSDESDSFPVCIRKIDMENFPYSFVQPCINFVRRMAQLSFPNVVTYIDAFVEHGTLYVVTELTPCGTLATVLKVYGNFAEEQVAQIVYQLLSANEQARELGPALAYDPDSIFLFEDGTVKAQFDLIQAVEASLQNTTQTGLILQRVPAARAPEAYVTRRLSSLSVPWAIGSLILYLMTGEMPFVADSALQTLNDSMTKELVLPKSLSPQLELFLQKCFRVMPKERITVREMKLHPWMLKTASHNPVKRLRQLSAIHNIPLFNINTPIGDNGLIQMYQTQLIFTYDLFTQELSDFVSSIEKTMKLADKAYDALYAETEKGVRPLHQPASDQSAMQSEREAAVSSSSSSAAAGTEAKQRQSLCANENSKKDAEMMQASSDGCTSDYPAHQESPVKTMDSIATELPKEANGSHALESEPSDECEHEATTGRAQGSDARDAGEPSSGEKVITPLENRDSSVAGDAEVCRRSEEHPNSSCGSVDGKEKARISNREVLGQMFRYLGLVSNVVDSAAKTASVISTLCDQQVVGIELEKGDESNGAVSSSAGVGGTDGGSSSVEHSDTSASVRHISLHTPQQPEKGQKISPAEEAGEKKLETFTSSIGKMTSYFVSRNEVMKLASVVYGKSLDSLEYTYQGPLSVLQTKSQGAGKWKDCYAMLRDNFLFFAKGPKTPPSDAIYFNSITVKDCDPTFFKRKNCFSVHTQLFSAPDEKTFGEWKSALSHTPRWFEVYYDEVSAATIMAYCKMSKKALKTDSSLMNASPNFGFTIEDIAKREGRCVPALLEHMISYILKHGLDEEGIFRISGSTDGVRELQESFDTSPTLPDLAAYDIHTVCSVFKSFFRSLPAPVIGAELETKLRPILLALRTNQYQLHQGLSQISSLLKMTLSAPDYQTLKQVFRMLFIITEHSAKTKMTQENLLTCLNPSLRLPNDLFRVLIKNYREIFAD